MSLLWEITEYESFYQHLLSHFDEILYFLCSAAHEIKMLTCIDVGPTTVVTVKTRVDRFQEKINDTNHKVLS